MKSVDEQIQLDRKDRGKLMTYDSRPDTYAHIATVREHMFKVIKDLLDRAKNHDMSKLIEPELEVFNQYTPLLQSSTYGSQEYKGFLDGMGPALRHHYKVNDHHPEHFKHGIADMDLVQVIEMLCDWKAATLRHDDGDLRRSIEQNADRFGYGPEMIMLLLNTAENFGWL